MGIESDKLVYDYLGKVGDLAQQQGLLSGDRVRLVTELRAEIDRQRAAVPGGDSPAAVKKLLAKIGSPAEVVVAAGGRPPGAPVPIEPTHIEPGPNAYAGSRDAGEAAGRGGASGAGGAGAAGGAEGDGDRGGIFSAADQAARAAREKLARLTDISALSANLTSGFTQRTTSKRRDESRPPERNARPAGPGDPASPGGPAGSATPGGPAQPSQPTPPAQPTQPAEPPEPQSGPRLRKEPAQEAGGGADAGAPDGFAASFAPAPAPRWVRPPGAASPPHLAGEDELGPRESNPDWWLSEPGPMEVNPFDGGVFAPQGQGPGFVDGFVGGIELPELLKPPSDPDAPPVERAPDGKEPADGGAADGGAAGGAEKGGRRGLVRRMLRRRGGGDGAAGGGGSIAWLAVLAALFLVGGVAFGSWIALGVGWVLAYNTRSLSRNETNFATIGVPSLAVVGGLVWLWGRFEGRWGEAIPEDGMSDAMADTAPGVIRAAGVGSALYLAWRVQRKRKG